MDKQYLKRELTELAHYIWCIGVDSPSELTDDEIEQKMSIALRRLCDLKVLVTPIAGWAAIDKTLFKGNI